jgi:hypothetical protein
MKKLENEYRKTTSNTLLKGFDKAKSGSSWLLKSQHKMLVGLITYHAKIRD